MFFTNPLGLIKDLPLCNLGFVSNRTEFIHGLYKPTTFSICKKYTLWLTEYNA